MEVSLHIKENIRRKQELRSFLGCHFEVLDRAVCSLLPFFTLAVEAHAIGVVVKLRVDIEIAAWERLNANTNRVALALRKDSACILVVALEHSPRKKQLFVPRHI